MTDKVNSGDGHAPEDNKPLKDNDETEVKIVDKKGETKVDLGNELQAKNEKPPGLTKEELMAYSDDPFWVRLRWALFFLFWLIWVAMLAASVVIIIYAPKCPSPEPRKWWQKGPIYQLDVKNFKDSDGDGVGDLQGVIEELDYIVETGATAVHLSSIAPSVGLTSGSTAVVDYRGVDSNVGDEVTLKKLLEELESRQLKVIVDFFPNHCSDQHEWFEKSVAREAGFEDFFVWRAGASGAPPTNYQSKNGGSGWTFNADRNEWYLHSYGINQPDLNLQNQKVVDALKDVMKAWLKDGVDGFNVDSADLLVEDFENGQGDMAASQEVLAQFREVINAYSEESGEEKMLMAITSLGASDVGAFYGEIPETSVGDLIQLPVGESFLADASALDNADSLKTAIKKYTGDLPESAWPAVTLNSAGLTDEVKIEMMSMLTMLLPISTIIPAGKELGLAEDKMDWNTMTEMEANIASGSITPLSNFRLMASLRHDEAILRGTEVINVVNSTLVVSRVKKGYPGYLCLVNPENAAKTLDLSNVDNISEKVTMLTRSSGPDGKIDLPEEKRPLVSEISIEPLEARVFMFVPKFNES